ncbi:S-adenosyl-L-methionine-dependent methyltransferase [Scheffersomyces coipomensis]|uniref:S-adenosyl-L-methionine-dependent methyltransferase n=1 Tax=Scheffersomyces coipomensis TaxID=1788519 RepID=UPI00315CB0B0
MKNKINFTTSFDSNQVMLRSLIRSNRTLIPSSSLRSFHSVPSLLNKQKEFNSNPDSANSPTIDENGLYYGKFTKQEYEDATKVVKQQIEKLEGDIKGDFNVRDNLGKVLQFPQRDITGSTKVENLTDLFVQTIQTTGPITLSAYIRQCLTHPDFGYYTTRNPLDSRSGDFITSPEISFMFGEMIGIWLFTVWQQQNYPTSIKFIEFGPGRGTLMHDVLKSFNLFATKVNKPVNIEINLIEASKILRQEQWKLLCEEEVEFKTTEEGFNTSTSKWGNQIKWLDTEKDIINDENIANYIIAHEFFDALPVKSFQKTEHGWRELMVEHSSSVNNTQPKLPSNSNEEEINIENKELLDTEFHLTLSQKETPSSIIPSLSSRYKDLPIDTRIEICTEAELYLMKMIQLLNNTKNLGTALIIDYGVVNTIPEASLRGIYKHKFVSPFIKPGEVDLSIDVDFTNLTNLSSKFCSSFGPIDQGDWLHNLGIGHRVDQLIKKNTHDEEKQDKIYNSYRRLTDKNDKSLGSYKFLSLLPLNAKPPIGFETPAPPAPPL